MREAAGIVQRCVGRDMPRGVFASLISLTFNVGPKPVCSGSPGRYARAGDWPNTCKSLDLYRYAGGRVFRGLVLRRADERKVCEGRA
jgi:lysozyme